MGRLDGRVAIVTGGAAGMGAATCRVFAREGCKVGIGDRNGELGQQWRRRLTRPEETPSTSRWM